MKVPAAKIYFPKEDREDILTKIEACLFTGQLTLGKNGREFEEKFARYLGTKYAVAVNSGTSAIEIALRILGVEDKEVIVPTNTFFATVLAVMHAGAKVRFVDADPETFSINLESFKNSISENTVGVVLVHIAGIVTPRMPEIQKICEDNSLFLFEDAAHAHGSSLNGKMAGTFGVAASFSFYPTKVITSGEGGMIVTNSKKIDGEARLYRDQGKASFTTNIHNKMGYNWRMSELHAILGFSQFSRLEEFISTRNNIARIYDEGLKSISKVKPLILPKQCRSNYYKYIAFLEDGIDRTTLKKILKEKYEVKLSGEVYELPCHLQPFFAGEYRHGDFPLAEDICKRHICLPIYAEMTDKEAEYVIKSLEMALRQM